MDEEIDLPVMYHVRNKSGSYELSNQILYFV